MSQNIILDPKFSLYAICNQFRQLPNVGDLDVINWDAHADEASLPEGDLIGIYQYGQEIGEGGLSYPSAMFVISTVDDNNLERLDRYFGELANLLRPGNTHPLYNVETEEIIGTLTVQEPVELFPVSKTDSQSRPTQAMAAAFAADLSFQ